MKSQKKKNQKVNFIQDIVYNYKTKNKEGYTSDEMIDLLKHFPDVTKEQLGEALGVRTVIEINNEMVTWKDDVELALNCIINKRKPTIYEFD